MFRTSSNFWCCSSRIYSKEYLTFLAPSVHHLKTVFLEYVKEHDFNPEYAKVYDIENLQNEEPGLIRKKGMDLICPIDGREGAAYVHCLMEDGDDHVGTATHMLSYAWRYRIGDIVDTLVSYCEKRDLDPKRTYIWICCLCNNQHRIKEQELVTFDEFHDTFNTRVRGIGHVIAMMAPWNDPEYLKRVWCIFEMYASYTDNTCKVDIAMPPREQSSLIEAMKQGRDAKGNWGIDKLFTVLANTKIENAQASVESDRQNILTLIEEGPSFKTLNQEVNQLLRAWVKKTIMDALDEDEADLPEGHSVEALTKRGELANLIFYVASYLSKLGENEEAMELYQKEYVVIQGFPKDSDDYKVRNATCSATIGTGYFYLEEYDKALEGFEASRKMNEALYGKEHQRTATALFNLGATKMNLKNLDGALSDFESCVTIYEKLYGENHVYTADAYDYVGRVWNEKKDLDKALEMYKKALDIRISCRGYKHPDIAISLNSMGLLQRDNGEYEEALNSFECCLEIWEGVHGTEHYEVATTLFNMGLTYYDQKKMEKALELFTRAKDIREKVFGVDHPNTENVNDLINRIKKVSSPSK